MFRIDSPGATVDNLFTDGNPALSIAATVVSDEWLNAVQEEICNVVEGSGDTLDKPDSGQLLVAIQTLISDALAANPTGFPIGGLAPFDGIFPPAGWLLAYGQAVSRTTFANLFNAITATCTGDTTSGSPAIATVDVDFTGLGIIGATVEGSGIPAATTITAVTSNTLTLSANATATAATVSLRIFPHGNGNGSTTFNVKDWRGRAAFGRDNMGGTAANRVTSTSGIEGTRLAAAGGDERMQSHVHTYQRALAGSGPSGTVAGSAGDGTTNTSSFGAGNSQNMPPMGVTNFIIKT